MKTASKFIAIFAILCALSFVSCDKSSDKKDSEGDSDTPPAFLVKPMIFGNWQVVSIDGETMDDYDFIMEFRDNNSLKVEIIYSGYTYSDYSEWMVFDHGSKLKIYDEDYEDDFDILKLTSTEFFFEEIGDDYLYELKRIK